jgi:hypothetical protein
MDRLHESPIDTLVCRPEDGATNMLDAVSDGKMKQLPDAAARWSPEDIFHDPLSNSTDGHARQRLRHKPAKGPQPRRRQKPDRRQLARIEAIEAVSRDLALLAAKASAHHG